MRRTFKKFVIVFIIILTFLPQSEVKGVSNSKFIDIAAGDFHTVALKDDGTVWSWGDNSYGQLGDGTTDTKDKPIKVVGLSDIKAIAAGDNSTLALKKDGTVWSWGCNQSGELGLGIKTNKHKPAKINPAHIQTFQPIFKIQSIQVSVHIQETTNSISQTIFIKIKALCIHFFQGVFNTPQNFAI